MQVLKRLFKLLLFIPCFIGLVLCFYGSLFWDVLEWLATGSNDQRMENYFIDKIEDLEKWKNK